MEQLLAQVPQQVINGLTLGSVYALIALGYSMVYGILQLLNFAHGDVYMVGAFIGFGVLSAFVPDKGALLFPATIIIILTLISAMIGCGFLGVAIEWFAYRPLRNSPRIAPLISALGVSILLQNGIQLTLTAAHRTYHTEKLIPFTSGFDCGDTHLSTVRALVIGAAILLMLGLTYLVNRTQLGRAMRAVAIDREAAAMMGINVDRIIVATFFIGSALAGVAGVLNGFGFTNIWHTMGVTAWLHEVPPPVVCGIC